MLAIQPTGLPLVMIPNATLAINPKPLENHSISMHFLSKRPSP
jgi:hypothetical protein